MADKPVCNVCGCYPFPTSRTAWQKTWCVNCLNDRLNVIEEEFRKERARTKETVPTQEEVDDFLSYLLGDQPTE